MEAVKIAEEQRKSKIKNDELEHYANSFVIFPYQVSGYIDYSNRGYSTRQINPDDYETFKRVWTGNDACVINWKNSCYVSDDFGKAPAKVKWQLGEYFYGQIEGNSKQIVINKDKSYSDYTSQETQETITMRVDKAHTITDYYNFMFYKIPEISKSTLFRIESIEKDFIGKELAGYIITFRTINQELANTGRARQQNIMPCAPGQGYLEAVVYDIEEWEGLAGPNWQEKYIIGRDYFPTPEGKRIITADFRKAVNDPVKRVVVKLFGAGIINSFVLNGRPCLLGDDFTNFRPSRPLFPINITSATTPNLVATQNDQTNFYFGDFYPTLEYFKDLMSHIKDSITPVNKWDYQGWLKYNYNELKKTNPVEGASYKNDLYGWLDTSGSYTIQKPWEFINNQEKVIDTSGIIGLKNNYTLQAKESMRIEDHFFDNFWTTKMMKVLPIETTNTLSFGQTLSTGISAINTGGVAGWTAGSLLLGIGILGTLKEKLKPKTMPPFRGIIPASLIEFNNGQFKNDKIPFNTINSSQEDSPNTVFFSGSTIVTSFEADLTEYFDDCTFSPRKTFSTINIGQTKDENGNELLAGNRPYLIGGNCRLLGAYNKVAGYIIDSFKLCACFNGEISVEFKNSADEVVWSGVYQSEGKWTNSLREIWTEKNTSIFGRENIFLKEPPPNIKDPAEPNPTFPTALDKIVDIDNTIIIHQGTYGNGRDWSVGLDNGAKWGYWIVGGDNGSKWWSADISAEYQTNNELNAWATYNPQEFFKNYWKPDSRQFKKVSFGTYELAHLEQSYKAIEIKYCDYANTSNGPKRDDIWFGSIYNEPPRTIILSELFNNFNQEKNRYELDIMRDKNNQPVDFFDIASSVKLTSKFTPHWTSVAPDFVKTRLSTQSFFSNMKIIYDVASKELFFEYIQHNPWKGDRENYSAVERTSSGQPMQNSNHGLGVYDKYNPLTRSRLYLWDPMMLQVGCGLKSIKLKAKTSNETKL